MVLRPTLYLVESLGTDVTVPSGVDPSEYVDKSKLKNIRIFVIKT